MGKPNILFLALSASILCNIERDVLPVYIHPTPCEPIIIE